MRFFIRVQHFIGSEIINNYIELYNRNLHAESTGTTDFIEILSIFAASPAYQGNIIFINPHIKAVMKPYLRILRGKL